MPIKTIKRSGSRRKICQLRIQESLWDQGINTLAITLNNMSMQGTWCDALFVQAVADCQNVAIDIIESQENFAWETLI